MLNADHVMWKVVVVICGPAESENGFYVIFDSIFMQMSAWIWKLLKGSFLAKTPTRRSLMTWPLKRQPHKMVKNTQNN